MTELELQFLINTINSSHNYKDAIWTKAFTIYNAENERKLSMFCKPCYQKVLSYLITKNTNFKS